MSHQQVPSIGRIVHYTLSEQDAIEINRRRADAKSKYLGRSDGAQLHLGNRVEPGEVYPMMITRVWGDQPGSAVNGQVHLDGTDLHWVTSVSVGEGPRHFAWPGRV